MDAKDPNLDYFELFCCHFGQKVSKTANQTPLDSTKSIESETLYLAEILRLLLI